MISLNDTHQPTPTYRIRKEAEAAAILVLGPLAIREFDFVTFQLDNGRWDWDVPVAERPLSAAVIKANGGKKFLLARAKQQGTAMAKLDNNIVAPACNGLDIERKAATKPSPTAIIPGTDTSRWGKDRAERRARRKAAYECLPKARVDSTETAKHTSEAETKTSRPSSGKTKTALIGELLTSFEGCTTADILAATGWPSVSVPAQAKACNLVLRKEKIAGQPTRYYGSK